MLNRNFNFADCLAGEDRDSNMSLIELNSLIERILKRFKYHPLVEKLNI